MKETLCSVTVKSEIVQENDREVIETFADGFFRLRDDGAEIYYKEKQEDSDEDVKVRITLTSNLNTKEQECRIHKEGAINSDMLFIPNFETVSSYQTPFGTLNFTIDTGSVFAKIEEGGIKAVLSYRLLDKNEVLSEAEVSVTAVGKTCPGR